MALNFNTAPYNDDFDPNKNYHRILFKPGVAVQARELTQSQTILQNQISEFASSIFSQNTPVSGGNVTTNLSCNYIKLNQTYNNATISAGSFLNKIITDSTGTVLARVIATSETTSLGTTAGDPPTLIVTYISGTYFSDAMQIFPTDGSNFTAITSGILGGKTSVGKSSVASISPGVFYIINGYSTSSTANGDGSFSKYSIGNFVNVLEQTVILDKYDNTPSARVGLEINETIYDYINDSALLDPAVGASNFQAPGADRYTITLTLTTYPISLGNDSGFIELVRISSGQIIKQVDGTVYSTIDDYFAKRDFETNGDYIVNPFTFTPSKNSAGNVAQYDLNVSKGIAYVHGYRIENQSNIILTSDRAITSTSINVNNVQVDYGNYYYVDTISGFFDTTTQPSVDIHCVPAANIISTSAATYNSTLIGSARIRNLTYVSDAGSSNTASYIYKSYLSDVSTTNLTGIVSSGATSTTITINDSGSNFSLVPNAYYNMTLTISSGTDSSSGDVRYITSYSGASKIITVNSPFTITPDATSRFTLSMNSSDAESVVQIAGYGSYALTANSNINASLGKQSSTGIGNAIIGNPQTPEMLFVVGNPYVSGISGSTYTTTKNWRTKLFSSGGVLTLNMPTGPLKFIGSGILTSASIIKQNYIIIDSTTKQILDITPTSAANCVVNITSNQTQATFTAAAYANKSVNIITTTSVTNADNSGLGVLKSKNLIVGSNTVVSITGPSSGGALNGSTYVDLANGQVYITNAGAASAKISLYVSDVKRITKIIDTGSYNVTPTLSMLTSSAYDVTAFYLLNNGQQDSHYDHASISLIPGAGSAKGNILIIYDRYSHTSGDGYFSCLSYLSTAFGGISTAPESYQNIPTYTAQSGNVYRLADSLDFRSVRASAQSTTAFEYNLAVASDGGSLIPTDLSQFQSAYSYYLPRKDILILSKDKSFQIIEGTPSTSPIYPTAPSGALILANLALDPYTAYVPGENPSGTLANLSINTVPHNRWAKSDITELQTRVNNLEYYTSLSVLEQNAQSMQVSDVNGLNRFKNGILVDDFSSYSTADTANLDFAANINIRNQQLTPITLVDNFQLQNPIALAGLGTITATNTFAITSLGGTNSNLFTLPYTTKDAIVQPLATSTVSLNPFSVTIYQGTATLFPPMDNWVDTTQAPALLSSNPSLQVSQQTNGVNIINAGDFAIIPGTLSSSSSSTGGIINHGAFNGPFGSQVGYSSTTTSTYASMLQNISTSINSSTALNVNNGYLTNISILPYIRPQQIGFNIKGLLVNTPISIWFDGVDIHQYITTTNTIELTSVSGVFTIGDIIGFYILSAFNPTARVEGIYVYPNTNGAQVRLYISNLIGAPTYTTTNVIQNAQFNVSGNYIGHTASGSVNAGVAPILTSGQVTSVGGSYTLAGAGTTHNIFAVQDPNDWCSFMNQYAVWGDLNASASYSATFTVNFPVAGNYTFITAVDSSATIYLNGAGIISVAGFTTTQQNVIYVAAGNNTLSWAASNSGGPAGIAVVINDSNGNSVFTSTHPTNLTYSNVATELVMPLGGAWFTGVTAIALDQNCSNVPNYYVGAKINITSKYVYQYTTQTATYVPPPPAPSTGGGGGCIICTKLFELGLLDQKLYAADEQFGKLIQKSNPKVYEGYIRWASIVVAWMNGEGPDIMFWIKDDATRKATQQEMVTRWTKEIATPWAEHMAYKMGAVEKDNKIGKFMMIVGFPISKMANLLINNKKPGIIVGYSMWALFSVLYSISNIFQKETK